MLPDYSLRARRLVGTRFRPQGRTVQTGVDCVGLVLATFEIADSAIRRNYRLRGNHRSEIVAHLSNHFRRVRSSELRSGDVFLLSVASDQFHLAVRTDSGFVHADAKVGRVVETPGHPKWPIAGAYRRRARAPDGN